MALLDYVGSKLVLLCQAYVKGIELVPSPSGKVLLVRETETDIR